MKQPVVLKPDPTRSRGRGTRGPHRPGRTVGRASAVGHRFRLGAGAERTEEEELIGVPKWVPRCHLTFHMN